ncbi:hypothetical protein HPP92_011844 [Vanilla planifolia]|uniref:Uncharacterized protein n=1 Tax=Vanilla planifolia TaxID=51239 RepID=A0A835V2R9_VANPL|nr:hypothetical protein HPP92_011844 [Vanilla planifolia]
MKGSSGTEEVAPDSWSRATTPGGRGIWDDEEGEGGGEGGGEGAQLYTERNPPLNHRPTGTPDNRNERFREREALLRARGEWNGIAGRRKVD